jgi:hypothetical protein
MCLPDRPRRRRTVTLMFAQLGMEDKVTLQATSGNVVLDYLRLMVSPKSSILRAF